jgi:hypothetical protein
MPAALFYIALHNGSLGIANGGPGQPVLLRQLENIRKKNIPLPIILPMPF